MNGAWEDAVRGLAEQINAWKPEGFTTDRSMGADASPALVLVRGDRRVYLEAAHWAGTELPAVVDLWSDLARTVRLVGPQPDGSWRVFSSDNMDFRKPWEQAEVARMIEDLVVY